MLTAEQSVDARDIADTVCTWRGDQGLRLGARRMGVVALGTAIGLVETVTQQVRAQHNNYLRHTYLDALCGFADKLRIIDGIVLPSQGVRFASKCHEVRDPVAFVRFREEIHASGALITHVAWAGVLRAVSLRVSGTRLSDPRRITELGLVGHISHMSKMRVVEIGADEGLAHATLGNEPHRATQPIPLWTIGFGAEYGVDARHGRPFAICPLPDLPADPRVSGMAIQSALAQSLNYTNIGSVTRYYKNRLRYQPVALMAT